MIFLCVSTFFFQYTKQIRSMLAANGVARAARVAIPLARGTRNMSGHGSPEEIYQSKVRVQEH